MNDQAAVRHRTLTTPARLLALAGVGYAVLTMAGNLTIGEFPDARSPVADLTRYYATHGDGVRLGGQLMILGALFLGLFGVACYAMPGCARRPHHQRSRDSCSSVPRSRSPAT